MKPTLSGLRVAWAVVASGCVCASANGQTPWINEFHYDNAGTDTSEFVEIVAPVGLTDLAAVRLTLYNGGDGTPYGSAHALSSFTPGEETGGLRFYSKLIGGLQNGAPDGISLDLNGTVLQFLGYEGSFLGKAGPAEGLTALDIGVAELDTAPVGGALALTGAGGGPEEFLWAAVPGATPGGLNQGQLLVPEPAPVALLVVGWLVLAGAGRRRIARPH